MVGQQVRRRTGGRSARVRGAVLQAALEAMAEHGLDGVTISEIARRAGVHATSIQRRWGSRENVALDAMLTYSQEKLPIPDTGSLRSDLIAFARSIAAYLDTPLGEALARTMAATDDDPALVVRRIDHAADRRVIASGSLPAAGRAAGAAGRHGNARHQRGCPHLYGIASLHRVLPCAVWAAQVR